jgi:hypothetical protein
MMINTANKIKIKEYLKVNLETLQGQQLTDFMERHDIREAGNVEIMMLDHGYPGAFVAFKNQHKPDSYFITTYEMMEKILFLDTLDPDNSILKEQSPVRIN